MYDPQFVLNVIDSDTVPILLGFTLAMILQNVAMGMAVMMTRREGWISIPLPCTFLWIAHDFGVVVRFNTWYSDFDHWFLKVYWVGMLIALLIELVFLWQAYKVGRKEYLPNGTQAQWGALLVAGTAMVVLCWEYLKLVWDDPLYQALASITMYLIPLAVVPLVLRRRSAVSQSPIIYGCFAAMVLLWWGVTAGAYGDAFRTWQYLASGVVAFATLTALAWWIHRLRQDAVPQPDLDRAPTAAAL